MRDLQSGRWGLSRTSYEYYSGELSTTIRPASIPPPVWEESAHALTTFWRSAGIASGERVIWVQDSEPVLLVWRARGDVVAGVALRSEYVRSWVTGMQGFAFGLETPDGRTLFSVPHGKTQAHRILSFANAHWRLTAVPTAKTAEAHSRQTLLLTGLSLVIVLVLTGSYAVVKAVSRELAVAQLQADFVSAVSHEFRSPLTTLRTMSEMLERGRVPGEDRKQLYYGLMSRETQRLHRLVEDLLDFGRMEAGAKPYNMCPTDISKLVPQAVAEFCEDKAASGFDIELRTVAAGTVLGDADALRRAVRNLLENAVKYSGDSRKVSVDVRVQHGHVCIAVEDYGMGIPPADLKRIFHKFERGSAAKASHVQGTGLGLAMVNAILHAHGGSVRVKSEEDRGSTFTLLLPCADAAEQKVAWHASC
jgi:signal transduction histidine kinase